MSKQILVRKPVKFCLGNPVMFGRIISKFMLKRTEGMGARFIWLRIGISGGFLSTGRGHWWVLVNVVQGTLTFQKKMVVEILLNS